MAKEVPVADIDMNATAMLILVDDLTSSVSPTSQIWIKIS